MVRRGARDAAVLQDVNDCIEALRMGVSSSFDDNGLTPLPAKVQEAVNSGKELKKAAERARGAVGVDVTQTNQPINRLTNQRTNSSVNHSVDSSILA